MIEPDSIIRFAPSDQPSLPEIPEDDPPDATQPKELPDLEKLLGFRPFGDEW